MEISERGNALASYATKIEPLLHYVRCSSCGFKWNFESLSSLSETLSTAKTLYKDTQLAKHTCPECGAQSLELGLKSDNSFTRPPTEHRSAPSSGAISINVSETALDNRPEFYSDEISPPQTPFDVQQIHGVEKSAEWKLFEIERRTDLTGDEKVTRIKHAACTTCAAIAVQPIPFADIFVLTPVQGLFASKIASLRGVPMSKNDAQDWTKQIVGLMGMGFLAQQIAIGIWKTVTFGAGGLLTIPLVYALTYGVMTTADAYFKNLAKGVKLSEDELRSILKRSTNEGKTEAEKHNHQQR